MINNETKFTGHWWLPGKKRQKLPGTFSFTRSKGISLELNGNFDDAKKFDPYGVMILCESAFGEKITLYQSFLTGGQRPFLKPNKGVSYFSAGKAFIGCHFERKEDAKFKKMAFRTNYLNEWLGLRGLDIAPQSKGFTMSYKMPDDISFPIDKDLNVGIGFSYRGPNLGSDDEEVTFQQEAYFIIETKKSNHFNAFGKFISHLDNFLALVAMNPVFPVEVIGFKEQQVHSKENATITVLLPTYHPTELVNVRFFDMLFTYKDISKDFGKYLGNWIQALERIEPIFDLYFGAFYNSNPNPIVTFLNYTQALETYHARTFSNEIDPKGIHEQRMTEILNAVPTEHKIWLKEKLSFSNSPSLAYRLRELIKLNPFPVSSMAGSHEFFIKRVRDSRNYYTHYRLSLKGKAESEAGIRGLNMILGTMLEAILLSEMGMDFPTIGEFQRKRPRLPAAWR